jgi:hypothetical protein
MKKTHFNDIKIKFISILAVYFLAKNDKLKYVIAPHWAQNQCGRECIHEL